MEVGGPYRSIASYSAGMLKTLHRLLDSFSIAAGVATFLAVIRFDLFGPLYLIMIGMLSICCVLPSLVMRGDHLLQIRGYLIIGGFLVCRNLCPRAYCGGPSWDSDHVGHAGCTLRPLGPLRGSWDSLYGPDRLGFPLHYRQNHRTGGLAYELESIWISSNRKSLAKSPSPECRRSTKTSCRQTSPISQYYSLRTMRMWQ